MDTLYIKMLVSSLPLYGSNNLVNQPTKDCQTDRLPEPEPAGTVPPSFPDTPTVRSGALTGSPVAASGSVGGVTFPFIIH